MKNKFHLTTDKVDTIKLNKKLIHSKLLVFFAELGGKGTTDIEFHG